MKKLTDILICIYKRYGHLFQGRLFYAVVLFYKENRTAASPFHAFWNVLVNLPKIRVYGGEKAASINKVLKNALFDQQGCHRFIYTWDVYKSVKLKGKILGNCTIDYSKVIDHPLESFYMDSDTAFARTNNAVLDSIFEYLERLKNYVGGSSIENKENIIKYLRRFRTKRAESAEEALQRILIINQIQWQLGHILVGVGRLDRYLDRFQIEDENSFKDMLHEFFELLHKYYTVKSNALMGDTGQIVILGGLREDDTYFCNRCTFAAMEVMRKRKMPDPKVLLRVSSRMPQELWDRVVQMMTSYAGSPLLSNDDQVIVRLTGFGYDKKDACNYTTSACWEPVAGECFEQNNILSLNYLEPFHIISAKMKPELIDSYEKLMERYYQALGIYIKRITRQLSMIKWEKDPLYSMFCDSARGKETDVSEGGGRYNNYGILTVGLANAVNALYHIKKYVFEEKRYTYAQLDAMRKNNFKHNRKEYLLLKNTENRFGCDDDDVVSTVNEIIRQTGRMLSGYRNPLGGRVKFGLSSPHYIMDSADCPASFDGRRKGEPFSVHISADGGTAYTELMNFASRLDYSGAAFNGNVVDFMVSPTFVRNNFEKFKALIQTGMRAGCYQMQVNIVDSRTLIAAELEPEKFPDLIVRVWGFNAYFIQLPKEYQDYLIERALQSELAFNECTKIQHV